MQKKAGRKSVEELKKFEDRVKMIIVQNESALTKAYLHPFQHVNKKLYCE